MKQFHDPKNLAAALGIEAAELNEVFLKTTEESREVELTKVKEELADVLAYALLLANEFLADPEQIVLDKVKQNALKHSVEKLAKGVATQVHRFVRRWRRLHEYAARILTDVSDNVIDEKVRIKVHEQLQSAGGRKRNFRVGATACHAWA